MLPKVVRDQRLTSNDVSRRTFLSLGASTTAGTLVGAITGCSRDSSSESHSKIDEELSHPSDNIRRSGFPIVKDSTTIKFMTRRTPTNAKDFNTVASWKRYQNRTNITVDWGLVPQESLEEKRNLALSSGDYPEVFYGCDFSPDDIQKYGRQGAFVELNPLIDKYMPNLKELTQSLPEVKAGLTGPDGSIYSLPTIWDPNFTAMQNYFRFWLRGDWLDKLDMDNPTDVDQFKDYLAKVKKRFDASGYCDANNLDYLRWGLSGTFGIGNRGMSHSYVDKHPSNDGKVRFYRITDEYKNLVDYLRNLYSDGLIADDALSIDSTKFYTRLAKGLYSGTVNQTPSAYSATGFVPIRSLKDSQGTRRWNAVDSALNSIGQFAMTDKCDHPVEIARWMDYFYSKNGAKLFFLGPPDGKDKIYNETKSGPRYIKTIRNPPKGATLGEALKPYTTYGGGLYPGFITDGAFISESATSKSAVTAANMLAPDSLDTIWPTFTYTQDENEKLDSLSDDIEKYVDESFGRFITGDLPLSSWSKYVNRIKTMGLDEYMEIHQSAYDRYKKNK